MTDTAQPLNQLTIEQIADEWATLAELTLPPLTDLQRTILRKNMTCAMSDWHFQELTKFCMRREP